MSDFFSAVGPSVGEDFGFRAQPNEPFHSRTVADSVAWGRHLRPAALLVARVEGTSDTTSRGRSGPPLESHDPDAGIPKIYGG